MNQRPTVAILIKLARAVSGRGDDPEAAIRTEIAQMSSRECDALITELASFDPPVRATNKTVEEVATEYIHEWCMVDPDYYTQARARLPRCA